MKMIEAEDSFLVTKEYKRFNEFCNSCKRDKYIGLCFGLPGIGKTISATHYSSWDLVKKYYRAGQEFNKPSTLVPHELSKLNTILYTAEVANSPSRVAISLKKDIYKVCQVRYEAKFCLLTQDKNYTEQEFKDMRVEELLNSSTQIVELLIVDESDRLKITSIEQLRDFYDKNDCGLVLIGMPGMEKRLSRYAQLYSRIGFVHEFRPLCQDELIFIMQNYLKKIGIIINCEDFTDNETMTAVIQTTRGNFRLLNRLFRQVARIIKINEVKTITKEIIFAARECLVIGV